MDALTVSIISLIVSAGSLGWNVSQFLLGGARPKAQTLAGARVASGLVTWSPSDDHVQHMRILAAQGMGPVPVIAVRVVNYGRAPMRVMRWSVNGIGGGATATPLGESIGPSLPHDLPAGSSEIWAVDLHWIMSVAETSSEVLGAGTKELRVSVETGTGKALKARKAFRLTG